MCPYLKLGAESGWYLCFLKTQTCTCASFPILKTEVTLPQFLIPPLPYHPSLPPRAFPNHPRSSQPLGPCRRLQYLRRLQGSRLWFSIQVCSPHLSSSHVSCVSCICISAGTILLFCDNYTSDIMHACMHVYTHTYMHVYMYLYMYVCKHTCIYTYTYLYMSTYIHV